jgi:CRP-like cAMP-binding protein
MNGSGNSWARSSMTACMSRKRASPTQSRICCIRNSIRAEKPRIEISNEELGHLVGASRQTVSQALQVLEKSGLIKTAYRMITVLDIERLRNFGRWRRTISRDRRMKSS